MLGESLSGDAPCGVDLEETQLLASFDAFRIFGSDLPLPAAVDWLKVQEQALAALTQSRDLRLLAHLAAATLSQNTAHALQLIKRFPGFDVANTVDFILEAQATHNRIKSINWLTVLGDDIVAELGGRERLRSHLEPTCTLHGYSGGIVIQAGERPQLGDIQRGDIPEAYRVVARVTRPVRFEQYDEALFRVPRGMDKRSEMLAWVRRFD